MGSPHPDPPRTPAQTRCWWGQGGLLALPLQSQPTLAKHLHPGPPRSWETRHNPEVGGTASGGSLAQYTPPRGGWHFPV